MRPLKHRQTLFSKSKMMCFAVIREWGEAGQSKLEQEFPILKECAPNLRATFLTSIHTSVYY